METQQQKGWLNPDSIPEAPPAYISAQQGVNTSAGLISLPEVVVNIQNDPKDMEPLIDNTDQCNFDFNNKTIRAGFIRKVYGLVAVQLLISGGIIAWFMNDKGLQRAVGQNFVAFIVLVLIVYISTACTMLCCEAARRRVPYNYLCLLSFTLALASLVGAICAGFQFQEVMLAGGITLAIVVALTLFAYQTRIDFTVLTGSLLCLVLVLILFGIALLATPFDKFRILGCALGVLLMCLYLVYDTQMMVGGKHRFALSPEEYVFAALNLYLDIMYIFLRILRMLR